VFSVYMSHDSRSVFGLTSIIGTLAAFFLSSRVCFNVLIFRLQGRQNVTLQTLGHGRSTRKLPGNDVARGDIRSETKERTRQTMDLCNVTLRHVLVTIVTVENA
jgi:hypothetical protein